MKGRSGRRLPYWLTVCWLLLCGPMFAQGSSVSCLDPEPRPAAPGAKPPLTHPDFQKGLEAFEAECWPDVAICMCRAEVNWPEDGELARFYDRWFPHYLPRYYLGLALYHLGCYEAALVQFEKSVLNQPQYAERAGEEALQLDRLSDEIRGLEDRADCSLWQAEDPPPECAHVSGRCFRKLRDGSP